MKTVFTSNLSRARIRSIWRTKSFGDRTSCRHCGYKHKIWSLGEGRWKCKRCRKEFGLLTNSVLSRTTFSLKEIYELLYWFELELSDHKIARHVNVDYHKVHRFYMRVREAIRAFENASISVLKEEVEVDETYFGTDVGNRRKKNREKLRKEGKIKPGRGANDYKQAVFGIYQRTDGITYVQLVDDVSKPTLQDIIKGKVSIETTIYSDTWKSYNGLDEEFNGHQTVNHGEDEYRRGNASINGIEGFWGYTKERLVKHHGMSPEHFPLYLKEIQFRYNRRSKDQDQFIDFLLDVLLNSTDHLNNGWEDE